METTATPNPILGCGPRIGERNNQVSQKQCVATGTGGENQCWGGEQIFGPGKWLRELRLPMSPRCAAKKNTTALPRIWDVLAGSLRGFIALMPYKQDYVASGADGRLMAICE